MPLVNGSGKEPTTAGIDSAALQSWRSHQTWSPLCSLVSAAPGRLHAVDVVEPVVLAAAGEPVDRLHEAAAVARGDAGVRSSMRITVSAPTIFAVRGDRRGAEVA